MDHIGVRATKELRVNRISTEVETRVLRMFVAFGPRMKTLVLQTRVFKLVGAFVLQRFGCLWRLARQLGLDTGWDC